MLKSFLRKQDGFASVEFVVLTCLALCFAAYIVDVTSTHADNLTVKTLRGAHGSERNDQSASAMTSCNDTTERSSNRPSSASCSADGGEL